MPRYPDPNAKTMNLIMKGKPGQEAKIRWFREWCARNGKEISEILYEKIEQHAKEHGFPNGRSQAKLDDVNQPKTLPLWRTCAKGMGEIYRGMFYCKMIGDYRLPVACTRCDVYVEG